MESSNLAENRNLIERIIQASPDIIYIYDIELGKNVFINDGIQKNLGYSSEEIRQMGEQVLPLLMHPDDFQSYLIAVFPKYQSLADHEKLTHEFRMKDKHGEWHWLKTAESVFLRKPDSAPKQIFGFSQDITEEKKANEAIHRSEEKYRTLTESLNVLVYRAEPETLKATFVNKAVEELYGYTTDEWLSDPVLWENTIYPEDKDRVFQQFSEMKRMAKDSVMEYRIIHKDGTVRWVIDRFSWEKDSAGRVIALNGIMSDITERIEAGQQLKQSEEKYRNLVENINDFICTHDLEGKILSANKTAEEKLGYSQDQLLKMNIRDLLIPQNQHLFDQYLSEIKMNGHGQGLMHIQTATGEKRIWEYHNLLHDPGNGQPVIHGVARDITERKKAEEKLQKSEELFSSIFHTSPAAIIITRIADGKIINANESFLKMFELSREETIGHTSIELKLLTPDARAQLIQKQIESGGLKNFEFTIKTKSGKPIHLLFSSKPMEINNEACYITTLIDITERKRAEEALVESNLSLSEAQRIANTGSWTYYLDGKLKWSDNMYQLYGLPSKITDLTPEFFFGLVHPDDREKMQKWMQASLTGHAPGEYEFRCIWPDGSIHYYRGSGELNYDTDNTPVYLHGTVQDITERKKAEEEIKNTTVQLRHLTTHLQTIQEEERKNISRIIHDELGQQLTGLKMDMTWISQQLSSESAAVMKKMDTMIELIDQTVLSVRRISSDLRPAMLDDLGLVAALQWMSRDFQERSGIKITFNTNSQDYLFKPEVATELYRIFQEALTNVVRHSGATEVKSSLTLTGEKIYLALSDNGNGFDPERVNTKNSLGLIGMRERAAMIHGTLEVYSDKQGTEVTVIIPIAEANMIV
jgi:PAS domain S-box-containing protein